MKLTSRKIRRQKAYELKCALASLPFLSHAQHHALRLLKKLVVKNNHEAFSEDQKKFH